MTLTKILLCSVIAGVVIGVFWHFTAFSPRFGSAAPSVAAFVASTSQPTVGTSASLLAATSSCAARIITTYGSAITLTFTERGTDVPSAINGHVQTASTTVAYDSGTYGCDAVQAWGFVSTKIYVTETR